MTETDDMPLITGEQLARFHLAKKVTPPKCWVCGTGSWYIQSDGEHVANALPWVKSDSTASDAAFTILILSCTNCGTIWSMDYQAIQNWLKENPA